MYAQSVSQAEEPSVLNDACGQSGSDGAIHGVEEAAWDHSDASDAMYRGYLAQVTKPDARVEDIANEAANALTELKRLSLGGESVPRQDFWREEAIRLRDELTISWGRINQLAKISAQVQGWEPVDRATAASLLSTIPRSRPVAPALTSGWPPARIASIQGSDERLRG